MQVEADCIAMKVRRTPPESKHSHHDPLLRSVPNESQASRSAGMVSQTVCEVPMAAPAFSWLGPADPEHADVPGERR